MLGLIVDWHKTLHLDPQEEDTWRGAASQFHLPYWDWARKQVYAQDFAIPQVCAWDTVDIIMPNGQKKGLCESSGEVPESAAEGRENYRHGR